MADLLSSKASSSPCRDAPCGSFTRRTCKRCGRGNDTANPFKYQLPGRPLIAWRRPKGRECGSCPDVLNKLSPEARDKWERKLDSECPAQQQAWLAEQVAPWEEDKHRTGGGRHRRTAAELASTTHTIKERMVDQIAKMLVCFHLRGFGPCVLAVTHADNRT